MTQDSLNIQHLEHGSIFISRFIIHYFTTSLLILASGSSYNILQKTMGWSKGDSYYLSKAAKIINNSPNSLIIGNSDGINFGNILALSHLVNDNMPIILVDGWKKEDYETIPEINRQFATVFLISSSKKFQELIQLKYKKKLEDLYYNDAFRLKKIVINK